MDLDSPFVLSSIFSSNSEFSASNSLAWNWVAQILTHNKRSSKVQQVATTSAVTEQVPLLIANKESLESDQNKDGAELFNQDLHHFILRKRPTTMKHSVDLLKDSVGEGSQIVAFSKAKTFMTGADQISHRGVECRKAKKRKLNIRDHNELPKHISLIMDTHNSYKILPGDSSGSKEPVLQHNEKELTLLNQISADPAECSLGVSQESHGKELQLVRQVSSTPCADGWNEILLEDTFAFGQQSNQQNSEELRLLKHIYAPPFANISKELLQVHGSGLGQHSSHWDNRFTLLLSAAEASDSGKLILNGERIETGLCLKCDEGGSLLACKGSSCSLAIHEKCIDSSVDNDEKGHFYCPLCSYSRAFHAYCKAKQKYSQAKEVLASFIDKGWMRHNKEQVSHLVIERDSGQLRVDGNIRCHGKHKKRQKNSKTSKCQRVEPIVHHRIGDVPGTTETSQYIRRTDIPNNTGESDNEMPVDVNIPPSQVMPLIEVKNTTVNGSQSPEFIKNWNTSNLKDMGKDYQSEEGKQTAEAKPTSNDSYLACEAAETSKVKEKQDVSLANLVGTCFVRQNKENQENLEETIEENIKYFHPMKELCSLTAKKCAKRKLKMQINNKITDVPCDNVNLTCEKGEVSRIVEAHALSQVNMKSIHVPPDKISEIQNKKHQEQDTCIAQQDTCNPTDKAVIVSAEAKERYSLRKKLHATRTWNRHPNQSGGSSFCNVSKVQTVSNNELNTKRTRRYWTPEEEKALKDAMQNISLDNGNIPWVNIWRKIKHTFQTTRQPGDLKDKWRNIMVKEARE